MRRSLGLMQPQLATALRISAARRAGLFFGVGRKRRNARQTAQLRWTRKQPASLCRDKGCDVAGEVWSVVAVAAEGAQVLVAGEFRHRAHIAIAPLERGGDREMAQPVWADREPGLSAEPADNVVDRRAGQTVPFAGPVEIDEQRPGSARAKSPAPLACAPYWGQRSSFSAGRHRRCRAAPPRCGASPNRATGVATAKSRSPLGPGCAPAASSIARNPSRPGPHVSLIAGRLLGIRERTACERKGDAARIDGSSMNDVRHGEIDQHSRKLATRRMPDNVRLSGTTAKQLAGARGRTTSARGWSGLPAR
jgi:hypothetical protein